MDEIRDESLKILYAIVRTNEDASVGEEQREAVRQIKRLATSGNTDAVIALDHLQHVPDMHPFLQEIIFSEVMH
jgi:hypothetical protein